LCTLSSAFFLSSAIFCIHLLVLLSGTIFLLNAYQIIPINTVPFSSVDLSCLFNMTSYCSTIFWLLIKVLYIYWTPPSPAWMFSVSVVLFWGFGTTWNLGVPLLHVGPKQCRHFSGWFLPCQITQHLTWSPWISVELCKHTELVVWAVNVKFVLPFRSCVSCCCN
jgi:hypothetical protein